MEHIEERLKIGELKALLDNDKLSVSTCTTMLISSLGCLSNNASKAHPNAHVAKEGFNLSNSIEQRKNWDDQIQEHIDVLNNPFTNIQRKTSARAHKRTLEAIKPMQATVGHMESYHIESLHLDDTHLKHEANENSAVYSGKKKYIERDLHSQFEDAEASAICLFYLLKSKVGHYIVEQLSKCSEGIAQRAVVKSVSAGNAVKHFNTSAPDEQSILMVERGKGGAEQADIKRCRIKQIVTVIDMDKNGFITITTHYPVALNDKNVNDGIDTCNMDLNFATEDNNVALVWNKD